MGKTFMPAYRTDQELRALQLEGLKWTVRHTYEGSDFYRGRFEKAGVTPDNVQTLEDIQKLPFTTADDLRAGYPFPLRSVPFEQLVRIHASSGTTGKRKVLCYTQKDVDDWRRMFARCFEMAGVGPGDRVHLAAGYGLWTAGVGFQAGIEEAGAMVIPMGPGNLDLHTEFLIDFQPTVLCSTASMALLLGEQVAERSLTGKVGLQKVILGSEVHSRAMDARIAELFGFDVAGVFDIPGMTELYGPGTGLDCEYHAGIHYWADYYILELLDPEKLQPVPEGELGEMVVTTLRKEGSPLVRYRTRDLTRFIPGRCACGSVLPRHERLMGRSDDMFIFRATNIYPGQIEAVVNKFSHVSCEYNIVLERRNGKDSMEVRVERDPGGDPGEDEQVCRLIEQRFKAEVMVTPTVTIVDCGTLQRSERKSKRLYDNRNDGATS